MKLYSFSGSCALATHIVLEWIGKPYTVQLMQKDDLSKPEFRKLNPNGQVPTLEEDDGWVLFENAAILNYLADKYPESKLGGDGTPRGRAEVNRWLSVINSDMHPAFKPLFGSTSFLDDQDMIEKTKDNARQRLRVYFELMDQQLGKHDWLAGTRSIADPYLFVLLRWAKGVKVDLSGLDNLKQFEQRMRADASVQKALKAERLDQAQAT
ncbi:MAG: glutathione S-transferase family protein [Rhodanobacteraceae bacterium]